MNGREPRIGDRNRDQRRDREQVEDGDRERERSAGRELELGKEHKRDRQREHTIMSDMEQGSGDVERVSEALQRHPWPEVGDKLMVRLRPIPGQAPARVEAGADVGRDAVGRDAGRGLFGTLGSAISALWAAAGRLVAEFFSIAGRRPDDGHRTGAGGRPVDGSRSPAARPSGRLEALGAIAIAVAVVFVILSGTGDDIAPADSPEQRAAEVTLTASTSPGTIMTPEAGDGSRPDEKSDEAIGSDVDSEELGDPWGASESSAYGAAEPPPIPPDGTRLYASVAEMLADPPAPGETVWVDAYHGEEISSRGIRMLNFLDAPTPVPCPNERLPILDRPYLGQLDVFNSIFGTERPGAGSEALLIAAGLEDDGSLSVSPRVRLPRRGRLVIRLGEEVFEHCDDADRIAVVERVAHVFEEKTDWTAMAARIRASSSNGFVSGSTLVAGPDREFDVEIGAFEFDIPYGLEPLDITDASLGLGDVNAALALPGLPDHPIIVRRFLPGHPQYETMLERVESGLVERVMHVYPQRRRDGLVGDAAPTGSGLEFVIDGLREDSGGPAELGRGEVAAMTVVDGVVYRISTTPPADPLEAQPLLWWLETVVDRFSVREAAQSRAMAESDGAGNLSPGEDSLELTSSTEVGFEVWTMAAVDGRVLVGGPQLAVLRLGGSDSGATSLARIDLPSPGSLALTNEGDVERVAMQVTSGDREMARTLLSSESALIGVQALALQPSMGYAAVEWPRSSGLVWLYVIALEPARRTTRSRLGQVGRSGRGFRLTIRRCHGRYGGRGRSRAGRDLGRPSRSRCFGQRGAARAASRSRAAGRPRRPGRFTGRRTGVGGRWDHRSRRSLRTRSHGTTSPPNVGRAGLRCGIPRRRQRRSPCVRRDGR